MVSEQHLPPPIIMVLLSILGGTGMLLSWAAWRRLGAEVDRALVLALALLVGSCLTLVALTLLGVLLRLAGRSLGGCGTTSAVQAGLALAAIPQTLSLVIWLGQLVVIPAASFGGIGATSAQRFVAILLNVIHVGLGITSIYLAIAGIAAAHRVSFMRAIATWLLAIFYVLITMFTIFVGSAALITLRGG